TPAARKPSGAVTLMGCLPLASRCHSMGCEAGAFRQAEHQVGDLYRLAGRALAEVVDGADDDRAVGVSVGRDLQMGRVGTEGGTRGGPPPLAKQVHEWLLVVGLAERLPQLSS